MCLPGYSAEQHKAIAGIGDGVGNERAGGRRGMRHLRVSNPVALHAMVEVLNGVWHMRPKSPISGRHCRSRSLLSIGEGSMLLVVFACVVGICSSL